MNTDQIPYHIFEINQYLTDIKNKIIEDIKSLIKQEIEHFKEESATVIGALTKYNTYRLTAYPFIPDEETEAAIYTELFDMFNMINDVDRFLLRVNNLNLILPVKYGKENIDLIKTEIEETIMGEVFNYWDSFIFKTEKSMKTVGNSNYKKRTKQAREYYRFLFSEFNSLWLLFFIKIAMNRY